MNTDRRPALAALTAAGLLWGTTVPLSKLALEWLPPGWLTFARFGLAAAVPLVAVRSRLRAACTPAVLASGAIGYGGSVIVQNAGITRTSVSHAALLVGAAPVLVAIIAALWHHSVARPVAWAGFAVSLAGVALVAGGGGGGATPGGDGLVLASLLLSAGFTVAQTRLLRGRDPVAVTAVQFLAAALAVLPVAVATERMPAIPTGPATLLATAGLAVGGTLVPFTLFAYGQARVTAEVAGVFLNLEPLVGVAAGAVFFADPVGLRQAAGGAAILAGIALGSLRREAAQGRGPQRTAGAGPPPAGSDDRDDGRVPHQNGQSCFPAGGQPALSPADLPRHPSPSDWPVTGTVDAAASTVLFGVAGNWQALTSPGTGASRSGVFAVAFSLNGTILATTGSDGTARLSDAATHRQIDGALTAPATPLPGWPSARTPARPGPETEPDVRCPDQGKSTS